MSPLTRPKCLAVLEIQLTDRTNSEGKVVQGLDIRRLKITQNGVSIEWNDGHRFEYDAKYLRINCGCAECVEEWSQRRILDPASVPSGIQAEDHLMVGNYAVQFLWSDAHFTGIYPFDMLRRLCRCNECLSSEEKAATDHE